MRQKVFLGKFLILGFLILVFGVGPANGITRVEAVSFDGFVKVQIDFSPTITKLNILENKISSKINSAKSSITTSISNTTSKINSSVTNTSRKISNSVTSTLSDISSFASLQKSQLAAVSVSDAINIWKNYIVVPPTSKAIQGETDKPAQPSIITPLR